MASHDRFRPMGARQNLAPNLRAQALTALKIAASQDAPELVETTKKTKGVSTSVSSDKIKV